MVYFITVLSTIFVLGSGFLMISSQVSEYALSQRQLGEWVYDVPIAHRGLFNNPLVPENSLAAFNAAIAKGYAIELDVHLCADGEVVVFHDDDLSRVTGQVGIIREICYQECQPYSLWGTPETIPTLSQTLDMVQGQVPLIIEIKNAGEAGALEEKVYQILQNYHGAVMIASFNPKSLEWFRIKAPEFYRAQTFSFDEKATTSLFSIFAQALKSCKLSKPHIIIYNSLHLSPLLVRIFSYLKPFIAYNVNSYEEAQELKGAASNIIFEHFEPKISLIQRS